MLARWAVVVAMGIGCGGHSAKPEAPADQPPPAPVAPAPPPPPAGMTPEGLYAKCEERVEQPQVAGECASDADCATGGCGGEVCTTAAAVPELMTTCEGRICFTVLDSCGCVDGMCRWSLKDKVPLDAVPAPPGAGGPAGSLPPTK